MNKHKKYRTKNKERISVAGKMYRKGIKMLVLRYYGGRNPRCFCCGEDEILFLCLDHKNGGGEKHRKQVGYGGVLYRWIVKNNFPKGFQVLCHNCNMAKGMFGKCPHQM